MIEERQAQSQGVSPALASELIAQNIHPDQYIPKPKESLYRYIYRPDGSYEPLAQIRKLTAEEREAAQQNNPHYRQIPDYRLPAIEESSDEQSYKIDEIRYYQNHLNGAPEELVDSAGNILWAENPTAWGQDQYDVDSIRKNTHQPIRFQGQYRDIETGLHYNTFRYYNPHCGRFINQDPIGLNGGLNLYQYAPNPISWIDPWGLTCKPNHKAGISSKKYGHSRNRHGSQQSEEAMKDRARSTGNPQGHFSDNRMIEEAFGKAPTTPGVHDIKVSQPSKVFYPDGSSKMTDNVRVIISDKKGPVTSYPYVPGD